jgi:hypothetical protein
MANSKTNNINTMSTASIVWYLVAREYLKYERYLWPTVAAMLIAYIIVR